VYLSFWTSAEENKLKSSRVEFLVNKSWKKYIGKITRYSNYYIDILLVFKKVKILIIVIYILPNDKETKKLLQQYIIKKIRENERKNIKVIVIGNFNDIRSKILDQNNKESKRKQLLPLLAWLESLSCEDVYRKIHLYKREYTWSNRKTCSRIDYI